MQTIQIEQQHGVLLDANGLVVSKFGNWTLGEHRVSDAVSSVEYVDGPAAHTRDVADKYQSDGVLR